MARSAKALRRGVVRAVRDLSEFETIARAQPYEAASMRWRGR